MILEEKLRIFCFIAYFAVCPFLKWSPCKRLPVMIIFLLQELQLQCLSMFCHKEIGLNQYYQMKIQDGRFGLKKKDLFQGIKGFRAKILVPVHSSLWLHCFYLTRPYLGYQA